MGGGRRIDRRSFLSGPLAVALLGRGGGVLAQEPRRLPILPFNTRFSYWDHHWIQWLPDHPVYEAIEGALSRAEPGGTPLVRLWLTERAGFKRQVHYVDDAEAARSFGQEAHLVHMSYLITGRGNGTQDLGLRFTDKDGAAVHWRMRFPDGTLLARTGGGLEPQDRNAARSILHFWYGKPGAATTDAELSIGDNHFAVRPERPAEHGYHAAYDSGAYSAAIAFGPSEVVRTPDGFTSSFAGGRGFRSIPFAAMGTGQYLCDLSSFRRRALITLVYRDQDAAESYTHVHGDHHFAVHFDPPLPAYAAGGEIGFRMLLDDHPVASGVVRPDGLASMTMALRWQFAEPRWAGEAGLVTAITRHEDGGYAMRVSVRQ